MKYKDWQIIDSKKNPSFDNFFAGAGGVFYDVSKIKKEVLDDKSFITICKLGDDIWLNAFTRLSGMKTFVVNGKSAHILNIQISNDMRLFNENIGENQNDIQIMSVEEFVEDKFGVAVFKENTNRN